LDVTPQTQSEIVPQANFSVIGANTKTYFELQNINQGATARMICIPSMRYTDFGTKMNPSTYLQPKDFGYKGKFKYYFPYKINTKQWGTITYRCYLTDENPDINAEIEKYMKITDRPFL